MDLTTGATFGQVSQNSVAIDAASLSKAFEQVKDMRKKKGKRYPLALILTLYYCAYPHKALQLLLGRLSR